MAKKNIIGLAEPTQKQVRVEFNGQAIAESAKTILMRESSYEIHYYFPEDAVNKDYLVDEGYTEESGYRGLAQFWSVKVGDKVAENAAWTYPNEPKNDKRPDLRGYISFKFDAMDKWYEEAEEIIIHPRDSYHRVDIVRSNRHVRVEIGGVTVADTNNAMFLFETGLPARYYIPQDDIEMEYLTAVDNQTGCPYKGYASYWSVNISGEDYGEVVWGYPHPLSESHKIKGLLSFYNEKVDIYVDGELEERPQTVFA